MALRDGGVVCVSGGDLEGFVAWEYQQHCGVFPRHFHSIWKSREWPQGFIWNCQYVPKDNIPALHKQRPLLPFFPKHLNTLEYITVKIYFLVLVFLMMWHCFISMPIVAVGQYFPPGLAPYLEWLWLGSQHNWNQHFYWSVGKFEKGRHCLGTEASQGTQVFLHLFSSTGVGDKLLWQSFFFSIDTGAHTGLLCHVYWNGYKRATRSSFSFFSSPKGPNCLHRLLK